MSAEQIPYVAFLRAVNVGGRKVEMARLRAELDELGLGPVRTYIASGNVFFSTARTDRARLRDEVEQRLAEAFGFEVPTALYTLGEVEQAYAAAPFGGMERAEHERFSLLFTTGELDPAVLPQAGKRGDWEVAGVHGATAYVLFRVVDGKGPANPVPLLEKAFGVRATGRFHHTVEKIIAAARKD
ncbi:DUF1697 domain-containing protein [Streptacidiphilus jiangxiensis]|uniref:Uncharacterized conserved protein, DUF1697 family n=1 Tax=Streptacidiphilus jiangxiensis TaxID=235985 RepID=A0A1H7VYC4_STRJI|nr:DUF1697 domain-containing protein [Streptacidiphilus jiangxiensis]SEM14266.1 Uncharacterized conserved protein, DUF1697 family [Streptacidiphilus jiangxiensis]